MKESLSKVKPQSSEEAKETANETPTESPKKPLKSSKKKKTEDTDKEGKNIRRRIYGKKIKKMLKK